MALSEDLDSVQGDTKWRPALHAGWYFAQCFLRLANLPNFALERLNRYEASLWRQAGQILHALEMLDRRKPQERTAHFWFGREKAIEHK